MCNFGDEIFLKGGENVKPGKNAIFLKKMQNGNLPLKYRLKI